MVQIINILHRENVKILLHSTHQYKLIKFSLMQSKSNISSSLSKITQNNTQKTKIILNCIITLVI